MLEKGNLYFHDFDRTSKTYPLQSLKIKKGFKDGSGYKKRDIPVPLKAKNVINYFQGIKSEAIQMGKLFSIATKHVEKLSFKNEGSRRVDNEGTNDSLRKK